MNERIKKILSFVKGPSVLDVGCVGGQLNTPSPYWLHRYLHEKFDRVVGIDINTEAIRELKNLGYNVITASAEQFEIGEKFDTVIAGELIEHLSNPGKFLESSAKHLKPGGRVVITTPNPFAAINVLYAYLNFPNTCSNPEHTMWFCPSTFREIAQRYGYRVIHFELVEDYYAGVGSRLYRLFKTFVKPLLPKRLRNNAMLFVLELEKV